MSSSGASQRSDTRTRIAEAPHQDDDALGLNALFQKLGDAGYAVHPHQIVAIYSLALRVSSGDWPGGPRLLADLITPILARNRLEQKKIHALIEDHAAGPRAEGRKRSQLDDPKPVLPSGDVVETARRTFRIRSVLFLSLLVVGIGAAFAGEKIWDIWQASLKPVIQSNQLHLPSPDTPKPSPDSVAPDIGPSTSKPASSSPEQAVQSPAAQPFALPILLGLLPVVSAVWWLFWRRYKGRLWSRKAARSLRDLTEVRVLVSSLPAFERDEIAPAVHSFQRDRHVESDRIDIARSIDATVRAAGLATLVSSQVATAAQLVVLIEQVGRHDHLARIADIALDRLRESGLAVTAYYVVHSELAIDSIGRAISMQDLASKHVGENLLVVGPGALIVDEVSGALSPALDREAGWKERAIAATSPLDRMTQRKLIGGGYSLTTATPFGLSQLGQHWAGAAHDDARIVDTFPGPKADAPSSSAAPALPSRPERWFWTVLLPRIFAVMLIVLRLPGRFVAASWRYFAGAWRSTHWLVKLSVAATAVLGILMTGYWISDVAAFWDDDPDRGVATVMNDVFGDRADRIVYLDDRTQGANGQNWRPADSLWFDNVTQGSDLLPYDFFLVVKQSNGKLLRSNENMNNRYRYLVRKPTYGNPDGLPIGMVKDNYQGRDFMGFTCAACHTGQINYNGTGIRIDGAPAMADMDTFLTDLGTALRRAQAPGPVHDAFVNDVLALKGDYTSADQVEKDLDAYAMRLTAYRVINKSDTHYGFARLDAFGRIYNQVLEYVANMQDVETVLNQLIQEGRIGEADIDKGGDNSIKAVLKELERKGVLDGADRDKLIERLITNLNLKQVLYFRSKMFNAPNAPVSYPFLWDTPQHDYVQWNGIDANAGLGAMGRNVAETLAVFPTVNWSRNDHWTLAGVFSGQGLFNTSPIDFSSSVDIHNLALIEDKLKSLHSPVWPQNILPKLDQAKVARGAVIFSLYCAACHANINRSAGDRRVVAHISAQDAIGTDPMLAVNGVGYAGYSGILRNEYVPVGPVNLLLSQQAPVAALTMKTAMGVTATPDADKWWGRRFFDWLYDVIFSLRANNVASSPKQGDYHPDTTQEPLASAVAYKGRSLNGIWATAPYLHNGSVPNLYSLLLPALPMPGDPPGMKYRPVKFMVGSREFDPVNVGFKIDGYAGLQFMVSQLGNSNAGHEYGTRDAKDKNGNVILDKNGNPAAPALTEQQRWDLVEYLKSL